MRDKGEIFADLLNIAKKREMRIQIFPEFKGYQGMLYKNRIAIRGGMDIDKINYILAHELAHSYLHFDKGDTIRSDKHQEYEEQAERATIMLLDALETKISACPFEDSYQMSSNGIGTYETV